MSQSDDMAKLMALPAFRRFLFRSIQSAGILAPTTNGTDGRNLDFYEGRRSLGFELLRDADTAQPGDLQHPHSIMTLIAVLREEANPTPKEKTRGTRDRYGDITDE